MRTYNFLAIDIGATSGRAIIGSLFGVKFEMREIHRFPNQLLEIQGKYYWNVYNLYEAIKVSLSICAQQNIHVESIGIDTWGVDFGCIAEDGTVLGLPRAYRDPYTNGAPEEFFEKIPREEVYRMTGIQIMNFNSLFQLFRMKKENFAPLKGAKEILFMPDLLSYLLTGNKVCEYTDASTSQILNPVSKQFESSLLEAAGVSPSIMCPLVLPGTQVGLLTIGISKETGMGRIPVIAVAGHDTASAVAAVPAADRNFAYLSSGTWSLMGIEVEDPIINDLSYRENFTNEGGIEGTTRFLKNITGMWLLEQCRKEWEKAGRVYSYDDIIALAEQAAGFKSIINPDDPSFANPYSMTAAILDYCMERGLHLPLTDADYVRCIFCSLANRYKEVLEVLKEIAPFPIEKLHVIGGGSKNKLLNQLTANAIGIPVIAGPSEATAIGNCMMQAQAAGLVANRWEMRKLIAQAIESETEIFYPLN